MDVSVITSGHDVADARLHREVAALLGAGLRVEVLGLGDVDHGPPGALVVARRRRGGIGRAVDALIVPWRARAPVLLALDPDSAAGALLRRTLAGRIRVVADVHEDYEALLRDRAWARGPAALAGVAVARLGILAAGRADLTVVADDHLLTGRPDRLVLRNLPDPAMLPAPAPRDARPRALYVGDVRRSRGLDAMVDAVAEAGDWSLDLVGPVATGDAAALAQRLRDPALAGRVRLHGRLPPREAWSLARGAWAGLLLLEDTPAFRAAVPSKLYEYLACGLAVVTTDLPRSAALVRATGAGVVVDGSADAARALRSWEQSPHELERCRDAAVRASRAWLDGSEMKTFADAVVALARP